MAVLRRRLTGRRALVVVAQGLCWGLGGRGGGGTSSGESPAEGAWEEGPSMQTQGPGPVSTAPLHGTGGAIPVSAQVRVTGTADVVNHRCVSRDSLCVCVCVCV